MLMTPGRVLYERWLAAQDVSPDDLWDYLPLHEQYAWEALSGGSGKVPTPEWPCPYHSERTYGCRHCIRVDDASGEVPAGLTREDYEIAISALDFASTYAPEPRVDCDATAAKLRAALRGQEEQG